MSVVFSVTYNLPKYFEMKIGTREDIVDNVTVILPEIQPTGEKSCHFRGENVFDLVNRGDSGILNNLIHLNIDTSRGTLLLN